MLKMTVQIFPLGYTKYKMLNENCGDKAISIGEKSNLIIDNLNAKNSNID